MYPGTLLLDASRHRVDRLGVEAVIQAVLFLEDRRVEVPSHAEVHRQPVGHTPVVLEPRRVVVPPQRRVEVVVDGAAGDRAEQERGDRVAAERIVLVELPLREPAIEVQHEQVVVPRVGVPRHAHVEAAADAVLALRQRKVRLQAQPGRRFPVPAVAPELAVLFHAGRRRQRRRRPREEIEARKHLVRKLVDERGRETRAPPG